MLRWIDNIPIFSFLFKRGKCSHCSAPISGRYPLVEVLTGAMFFAVYVNFSYNIFTAFYYCVFSALLISATFIDLDFFIIPDEINFAGLVFGLIFSGLTVTHSLFDSFFGVLVGGGSFWLLSVAYEKITAREGLGFGDVKMLAMIGAFLGVRGVVLTILLSSLVGSVVGIVLMIVHKKGLKMAVPYGPFLAIGSFITLFWGESIVLRFYPF
jgi:leader peptidase (prepilin peptidase)/N-methyltransferase